MTWEDDLRTTAGELGRRLDRAHPNPPARRRVRPIAVAAAALILGCAALVAWPALRSLPSDVCTRQDGEGGPRDPAAAIEAQYADQITELQIDDPELRREFQAALAQVDRAIALAKDAVRRSPNNAAFAELCHLAHRAKVRLIQAYSQGG